MRARVKPSGIEEIDLVQDELARTGERMAGRLAAERQFAADASHQLRTPLTALVSRTQILERRLARSEPVDDVVAKLGRDAAAMSETLDELLTAASAEADLSGTQVPAQSEPSAATEDAVLRLTPLAEARGVRLVFEADAPGALSALRVSLPASALSRACIVLIDNALNYSPEGGTVTVRVTLHGRAVAIRVEDQGPGIAPAERERIFERFARGAETGKRRGFGLGLSLVRELAERAGGTVAIERTSAEGTVFLLSLPAIAAHATEA